MTDEATNQNAISSSRSRYLGLVAFAIIMLLAFVAVPILGSASTYKSGFSVDVTQRNIGEGNVYVFAPEMRFDASATKDVSIVTVTGNVHGRIGGNLNLLAGRTSVRADVDGSVIVAGGSVSIHGRIGGDLVIAGGNVMLANQASVSGDLIMAGGTVRIDGRVLGTVYGTALNVQQSGSVSGDMEIQTSRLVLKDNARVSGDIRYQSPVDASISTTARVTGTAERTNTAPWSGIGGGALQPFGSLLKLTWSLLAGAAVIAIVPRLASRVADHATPPLQPVVIGLLSLVLLPVIALLLIGTILLIPLGLTLLVLFPIGLYLSQVFAGLAIGRYLTPRSWRDGSRGYLLLSMTLGVIIIAVIRMVPIPFLGPIVTAIVAFWGFGSVMMLLTDLTSSRLRERAL